VIKKLFEEHALGNLADKRFGLLCSEYEREQENLEREIAELREGIGAYVDSADRFLALTKRYRDFSELTPTMLGEFVEKIIVHERADKWRRYTGQQVDIYLNFIGNFAVPQAVIAVDDDARTVELAKQKRHDYYREYARQRKANGGKPLTPPDTRTD
jgi:hypothetical protein